MAVVWLVPFVIIALTSVRSMGDLISNGVFAWPQEFVFANFERAWNIGNFSTYFRNSLILIVLKVPLGIVIASLAAFPLAKMQFRFSSVHLCLLSGRPGDSGARHADAATGDDEATGHPGHAAPH